MALIIRQTRMSDAHKVSDLISELGYPITKEDMESKLKTYLALDNHYTYVAEIVSLNVT